MVKWYLFTCHSFGNKKYSFYLGINKQAHACKLFFFDEIVIRRPKSCLWSDRKYTLQVEYEYNYFTVA